MGQTTSSHHGGSSSSSGSNRATKRNSKYNKSFSLRHSRNTAEEHPAKVLAHDQFYRDAYGKFINDKLSRNQKGGTLPLSMGAPQGSGCSVSTTATINDQPLQQTPRPITISEMNTYNIEKTNETMNNVNAAMAAPTSANNNNNNANKNNTSDSCSSSTTTTNSQSNNNSQIPNSKSHSNNTSSSKKDFYMVAEGYHKTDSCYYKTPDGGYHKLPPDSYHKMSEICYNKLPDGSFKRLVDIQSSTNNGINGSTNDATNNNYSHPSKVRNQMIRFLKRSKSHTPATAKELQKTKIVPKDSERRGQREQRELIKNANGGAQNVSIVSGNNNKTATYYNNNHSNSNKHASNSGNRKVVVTMMENGGLPIVATSKSKSPKGDYRPHSHHSTSNREKVTKTMRATTQPNPK